MAIHESDDRSTVTPLVAPVPLPAPAPVVRGRAVPARVRLDDARARLEDAIRRNPAQVLLVALGAGIVVGKLLHVLLGRATERRAGRRKHYFED